MNDDLRAITIELKRFLDQEREIGVEWYHDAGPVAEQPVAPTDPKRGIDTVQPVGGTMTKNEREDAFAQECDGFVRRTVELIASSPKGPATPELSPGDSKVVALASLADEVAGCTACKLYPTRTRTVFGVGNPDADIVFIGEAPGKNEDEQGEPFVGRAGKLLTDILKAIGFERDDIYICNILKCRPPGNRDPEADEVKACEPFLKRQLAVLQPRLICCLGRHAAMTLLQTRASLRSMRETVHFYEGVPVLATYHPAALLRNPHWKRDTWDDVRKLRALHDALVGDKS